MCHFLENYIVFWLSAGLASRMENRGLTMPHFPGPLKVSGGSGLYVSCDGRMLPQGDPSMVQLNFDHFYSDDPGARVEATSHRMKEASVERQSQFIICTHKSPTPTPPGGGSSVPSRPKEVKFKESGRHKQPLGGSDMRAHSPHGNTTLTLITNGRTSEETVRAGTVHMR